jgi:hypothetical protein
MSLLSRSRKRAPRKRHQIPAKCLACPVTFSVEYEYHGLTVAVEIGRQRLRVYVREVEGSCAPMRGATVQVQLDRSTAAHGTYMSETTPSPSARVMFRTAANYEQSSRSICCDTFSFLLRQVHYDGRWRWPSHVLGNFRPGLVRL